MQAALHSPKYLVLEVCVHAGAQYCPATSLLFYPGTGASFAGSTPYPCSRQAVQLGLSLTDGRASWALGSTTKFYMQGPIRKKPMHGAQRETSNAPGGGMVSEAHRDAIWWPIALHSTMSRTMRPACTGHAAQQVALLASSTLACSLHAHARECDEWCGAQKYLC